MLRCRGGRLTGEWEAELELEPEAWVDEIVLQGEGARTRRALEGLGGKGQAQEALALVGGGAWGVDARPRPS